MSEKKETEWRHEDGGRIKVTTRWEETPTSREERRTATEATLKGLRENRVFVAFGPDGRQALAMDECGKVSQKTLATRIWNRDHQIAVLQNAMMFLEQRLHSAINERDALEAAYQQEKADRCSAEYQRRLSDSALERTCKERDELKKQLRQRGKQ